jgi:DNA-binding LacI/PurR family transcriptional regulator
MAELLLALLAGEDPPQLDLLPTTLVPRQTS